MLCRLRSFSDQFSNPDVKAPQEVSVRELIQGGVRKIKFSSPYVLYQGQVFYGGMLPVVEPIQLDVAHLISIAKASGQFEKGKPHRLVYRIYANQSGDVVGLQRLAGPEIPEIEKELMRLHQDPVLLGPEPIAYVNPFGIYFIG
jgi:hypothetical protein